MKDIDYKELGLKSGVEIHHQIHTDKKLFCHCPSRLYTTKHDAEVLRHMRPTLSELGEYDGTALMEFKTKKNVVYHLKSESVCTYEMDDTPPFLVNQQGLDIALELGLLLNLNMVDEIHIARKQYLDGSIPTGFQRTAIIGVGGWIPFKDKKIGIVQLGFEEDSCREISDVGHTITFRTDRLGMPLIEVVTEPVMHTPQEVAEVVRTIGRLIRATGHARRGLGAVRQDVNVSIKGGERVEIKGVSKIGYIPALVHNEALRQKALLDIRSELHGRGIKKGDVKVVERDVANIFSETKCDHLAEALKKGWNIRGIKVSGFQGIFNWSTQPGKVFFDELKGRVRVIACLDVPPIMFYNDRFDEYGLSPKEQRQLNNLFEMGENDALVIVWGPEVDTNTATDEIRIRCEEAVIGVPNETRQPFPDGITDFERILPGADRMYPDTDSPATAITAERLERIRANLPEYPWDKEKRYEKLGLPKDVVRSLAISSRSAIFDRIVTELDVNPVTVGVVLEQMLRHLSRKGFDSKSLADNTLFDVFKLYKEGAFAREAFAPVLQYLCRHMSHTPAEAIEALGYKKVDDEEVDLLVKTCVDEHSADTGIKDDKQTLINCLMGDVMMSLLGSVPGKTIYETFQKVV